MWLFMTWSSDNIFFVLVLSSKFRFSIWNENIYEKIKTIVHNLIQDIEKNIKLKSARVFSSWPGSSEIRLKNSLKSLCRDELEKNLYV